MKDRKIVLLIDAENTSARYADSIVHYLEKHGDIICARIYGDFINNSNVKGWNSKAIEYEMEQKQQLTTSAGKNSSDIALVIDAMDLLYQKTIDILCIVTSDGDFTGLVKRIREDGIEVIGIGKSDASKRLEKVCNQYLDFDELMETPKHPENHNTEKRTMNRTENYNTDKRAANRTENYNADKRAANRTENYNTDKRAANRTENYSTDKRADNRRNDNKKMEGSRKGRESGKESRTRQNRTRQFLPLRSVKMTLNELVQQYNNIGKLADLGGIKSQLQLKYPEFDERNYGYRTIRELIDKETKFEVYQDGRHTYVSNALKHDISQIRTETEKPEGKSIKGENIKPERIKSGKAGTGRTPKENEKSGTGRTPKEDPKSGKNETESTQRKNAKNIEHETAAGDTELENVCWYILEEFPNKVIGIHEMGALGRKLHKHFPDFSYKEYGYAKLSGFLEEMGYTVY